MREQQYARIHPDAKRGQAPIASYDTAGIAFKRGVGPYKGWHPVSEEQVEKLRRLHITPGNLNSMRVFQIELKTRVDEIAGSEARVRMSPEQQRLDQARDSEFTKLKNQVGQLQSVLPLLQMLGDPKIVERLRRLQELDEASSGAPMDQKAGDRLESIAAAPPRRSPMDERTLDGVDNADKRTTPPVQQTSAAQTRPAQPPPARPGAAGKKDEAKGNAKKPDAPPPARPSAGAAAPAQTPIGQAPSAHEMADILAASDDEDGA